MDFDAVLTQSREYAGPLGVAFFVALRALDANGIDPELRQHLVAAVKSTMDSLPEDDRLLLGYVLDRRISETPFPGWVRLKSRMTTVEAHILHDALIDKGWDARIRREYESAADVLHPAEGVEVWTRPWHLKNARGLLEALQATSDENSTCSECSEESPGHFASCWNCGHSLGDGAPAATP